MTRSGLKKLLLCHQLRLVSRGAGLFLVIAVNAFVFFAEHTFISSPSLQFISEFVNHASEEHRVNNSTFTLTLHFSTAPVHLMDAAPAFPVTIPQFAAGTWWLMVFGLLSISICFCFFRGEESRNSQFIPGIILPPPKSY